MQVEEYESGSSEIIFDKNTNTIKKKKKWKFTNGRRYSKLCYKENSTQFGREMDKKLTNQVGTFCDTCEGQLFSVYSV